MGYRSDVAFAISKEAYFKHKTLLQKPLTFLENCDQKFTNSYGHYFITHSIKWYDTYPEVIEMLSLMEEISQDEEDGDENMHFAFCRIGEDDEDNEVKGDSYYFDLCITRSFDHPSNLGEFTG